MTSKGHIKIGPSVEKVMHGQDMHRKKKQNKTKTNIQTNFITPFVGRWLKMINFYEHACKSLRS